jgi:release factor glutamine methyltransferase
MTTVARLLAQGETILKGRTAPSARTDARLLLQHVLGIDHAALISSANDPVEIVEAARFHALVARRARGEPVSRIIGRREFRGLSFLISPAVLDPRPETELLVDTVLADQRDRNAPIRFADIGTGSGAIAISLLANLPNSRCVAADISPAALEVASSNARMHGVEERFEPVKSDLFRALHGAFDFVVSNPPYIRQDEIATLDREVRLNDPRAALDGGADGLEAYRGILATAASHLQREGALYLEIGAGQRSPVTAIAQRLGWHVLGSEKDLAGIDRVLVLRSSDTLELADALADRGSVH